VGNRGQRRAGGAVRILFHAAHPDLPTGYANQARAWIPRLADAGHEVAISCLAGVVSHMSEWRSPRGHIIPVYPATPYEKFGQDVVRGHYAHWEADLIITLTCSWIFAPDVWRDLRAIMITPVDIEGMGQKDYEIIVNTGATPAAVCRWGEAQMRARGLEPLYLPHGIETGIFKPPANRKRTRQAKGLDEYFLVGMNAMNHERSRKNFSEAFEAFAAFHAQHPKSRLLLHTIAILPEGVNLPALAYEHGIADAILWSDQYQLATGATSQAALADWYGSLDVLLMPGNEGFGLPTIEAQACGTPVIAGDWCTGPELAGETGWLCQGQREWNDWHRKHWRVPLVTSLTAELGQAAGDLADPKAAADRRKRARQFALGWDADRMWAEHWAPVFKELSDA
jgi:glycosyltransferase involved in cell wall biosynthesis